MKLRLGLALALLLMPAAAQAGEIPAASLFFTAPEIRKIETLNATGAQKETAPAALHLGAVLYYGPGDWVLWLDNQRWVPGTYRADLRIVDVKPGEVHFRWLASANAEPRTVTLRAYQTYNVATGRIVEGRQ